jgi:IS1 family transposase/transposase-like protein
MTCPACGSEHSSKNGKRNGKQCYKCKGCGYQFTVGADELEKRDAERGAAVALYIFGLSFRAIGRLFSVHASTVLNWARDFAMQNHERPAPSDAVVVELDEMWRFLESKKNKLWIWQACCRTTGEFMDWECGDRGAATLKRMLDRLEQRKVTVCFADRREAYAELISSEKRIQTKAQTHEIERNHFRQRHWIGRFRRKTCIVSRSKEMVDLSVGLFAKFHPNGFRDIVIGMFQQLSRLLC